MLNFVCWGNSMSNINIITIKRIIVSIKLPYDVLIYLFTHLSVHKKTKNLKTTQLEFLFYTNRHKYYNAGPIKQI